MALGSDPLAPDAGPNSVRIRDLSGSITLSVDRPAGLAGVAYSFDISPSPDQPWQNSGTVNRLEWIEPLGDCPERFHTLLIQSRTADHHHYFARLRVVVD